MHKGKHARPVRRFGVMGALLMLTAATVLSFTTAGTATAAPKGATGKCFTDDSGAVCTKTGQSFELVVEAGEWAGVYTESNQKLAGLAADELGDLGFDWSGASSGGSPRLSIPPDTDSDLKTVEGWLYVDTACDDDGDGTVSLDDTGCIVSDSFGYHGTYAAYATEAVVADYYAFLVADQPGTVTVSNVRI